MLLLTFVISAAAFVSVLKVIVNQEDEAQQVTIQFDALVANITALATKIDALVSKSTNDTVTIANLNQTVSQLTAQVQSLTTERDAMVVKVASLPATDDPAAIQAMADALAVLAAKIPA
jgi:hypothetical protein